MTNPQKNILLVSHAVIGYLSPKITEESIDEIVKAGVDIIELQIPFSDPQADGPFLTKANQQAVKKRTTVASCFNFAEKICKKHPQTNFVFMTYFNIVFKYGVEKFVIKSSKIGIKGIIIPDLPIEESKEYFKACKDREIEPILMFTPTTSPERMKKISKHAKGFIYCQARVGVTGKHTKFDKETLKYIARCKKATTLPIAMGFGIQTGQDVTFLEGKADIAICCTRAMRILNKKGPKSMGRFLKSLKSTQAQQRQGQPALRQSEAAKN